MHNFHVPWQDKKGTQYCVIYQPKFANIFAVIQLSFIAISNLFGYSFVVLDTKVM